MNELPFPIPEPVAIDFRQVRPWLDAQDGDRRIEAVDAAFVLFERTAPARRRLAEWQSKNPGIACVSIADWAIEGEFLFYFELLADAMSLIEVAWNAPPPIDPDGGLAQNVIMVWHKTGGGRAFQLRRPRPVSAAPRRTRDLAVARPQARLCPTPVTEGRTEAGAQEPRDVEAPENVAPVQEAGLVPAGPPAPVDTCLPARSAARAQGAAWAAALLLSGFAASARAKEKRAGGARVGTNRRAPIHVDLSLHLPSNLRASSTSSDIARWYKMLLMVEQIGVRGHQVGRADRVDFAESRAHARPDGGTARPRVPRNNSLDDATARRLFRRGLATLVVKARIHSLAREPGDREVCAPVSRQRRDEAALLDWPPPVGAQGRIHQCCRDATMARLASIMLLPRSDGGETEC